LNNSFDNKMLPNASHDWTEGLLQLPVKPIVKHVQQHDSLVSHRDVTVTLKLNEQSFNPMHANSIICNLSYEECPLDLFKIF
jgi:hypothetical protein